MRRTMNSSRLSLVAATVCLSFASGRAQTQSTTETNAALARASIQQAPLLPLEKSAVTIQLPDLGGRISAVAFGRSHEAYVLQRGDKANPIIVVDRNGQVLRSWGKGLLKIPHSIKIDPDGNVWTTDAGDGRVLKFAPDGKKLQEIVLGDAPVGKDCVFPSAAQNNYVDACGTTDIEFLPGGRLFLTDGYGKMRVLEYAANGKRIREWGGPGEGPGRFNVPHGLAFDGKGVLFVADRNAGRLQRFDLTGRYLGEWTNLGQVGSLKFVNGALWAATAISAPASQTPATTTYWVMKLDPATGKILGRMATTNSDFIDVTENGEVTAGASRQGIGVFSWFRPAR